VPVDRPTIRYRGHRVVKAQSGWTVWLDRREIGWASTRNRAKLQIDELLDGVKDEPRR